MDGQTNRQKGAAMQFPGLQFYLNPTIKSKFYHATLIWKIVLSQSWTWVWILSKSKLEYISSRNWNLPTYKSLQKLIFLSGNCNVTQLMVSMTYPAIKLCSTQSGGLKIWASSCVFIFSKWILVIIVLHTPKHLYIVTFQAHPALVKKANQMCGSFLFKNFV